MFVVDDDWSVELRPTPMNLIRLILTEHSLEYGKTSMRRLSGIDR